MEGASDSRTGAPSDAIPAIACPNRVARWAPDWASSPRDPAVESGASPRTGVKLSRLARALALVRGEEFVTIDLAKEVLVPGVSHRLLLEDADGDAHAVIDEVRANVRVDRAPARAG